MFAKIFKSLRKDERVAETIDRKIPVDSPSAEDMSPYNTMPYSSWRGQILSKAWNIGFPKLVKNQLPIANSLVPAEQKIILNHNSKLDELKKEAVRIANKWQENNIESLLADLIDVTTKLTELSLDNLETRKRLSFYQALAGLAAKEADKSTEYFQLSVAVMESIIEDFPEQLKFSEFRSNYLSTYEALWHSDSAYEAAYLKKRFGYYGEAEKDSLLEQVRRISAVWTEARIQAAYKWTDMGASRKDIAYLLDHTDKRSVDYMFRNQSSRTAIYRKSSKKRSPQPQNSEKSNEICDLELAVKRARASRDYVISYEGLRITLADLPKPRAKRRANPRKKASYMHIDIRSQAIIVDAIEEGLITSKEALKRYSLTPEDLLSWKNDIELYREIPNHVARTSRRKR